MNEDAVRKTRPAFRVAFREEGEWVNAYFASPETMEGAVLMASIRRTVLDADRPRAFDTFHALLRQSMTQMCVGIGAPPSSWKVNQAPDHEKTRGTH